MNLLDIGGGFPGSEDVKLKFEEVIFTFAQLVSCFCSSDPRFQDEHRAVTRLDNYPTGQRNMSIFFSLPQQITAIINPALDKYFPTDGGVRIIAEPGRYYVASAYTLAVNIIAKKVITSEQSASNGNGGSSGNMFALLRSRGGGGGFYEYC